LFVGCLFFVVFPTRKKWYGIQIWLVTKCSEDPDDVGDQSADENAESEGIDVDIVHFVLLFVAFGPFWSLYDNNVNKVISMKENPLNSTLVCQNSSFWAECRLLATHWLGARGADHCGVDVGRDRLRFWRGL
jgi:hypothetical protein